MGCDIHFFVEKFSTDKDYEGPKSVQEERNIKLSDILDQEDIEPRWITADSWELEEVDDDVYYWSVIRNKRFYGGRNYYLFGILAGVRYDRIEPISNPRGVPNDISEAYKEQLKQWEGDAHSKSYLTLKELLDVDWSKYDKEYISDFLTTIERMKEIDPDPEKVRCLFFFDN